MSLQELGNITVPTLVIVGGQDPIFPAHGQAMVKLIPLSRLLLIENMGHTLNPVFFAEIILAIAEHII